MNVDRRHPDYADDPWYLQTPNKGDGMTDPSLDAYIECALWASLDDQGEPLDSVYTADDLAGETKETMAREIADFRHLVDFAGVDYSAWSNEQFGHDFWLTRNGHGAGFWDRGHVSGNRLSELAHSYGEANLYVGDDGLVYQG